MKTTPNRPIWRRFQPLLLLGALAACYVFGPRMLDGVDSSPLQAATDRPAFAPLVLPNASGGNMDIRARTTGKIALINYWATWCPPCRAEIPTLIHIEDTYRDRGLETIGISLDSGSQETVRRFIADQKISYPIAFGANDPGAGRSIHVLPTTLLLDRNGRVARTIVGAVDERELTHNIETLLAEGGTH